MPDTITKGLKPIQGVQLIRCSCGEFVKIRVRKVFNYHSHDQQYMPFRGQCLKCLAIYAGKLPVEEKTNALG